MGSGKEIFFLLPLYLVRGVQWKFFKAWAQVLVAWISSHTALACLQVMLPFLVRFVYSGWGSTPLKDHVHSLRICLDPTFTVGAQVPSMTGGAFC